MWIRHGEDEWRIKHTSCPRGAHRPVEKQTQYQRGLFKHGVCVGGLQGLCLQEPREQHLS